MQIAAEFQAALPELHSILGLQLCPLSLGRYRLLKRFGCPFVEEENKEVSIQELTKDLFFSLIICGLSVSEFNYLLRHPKKLAKEARRFGKQAGKFIRKTDGFSILQSFTQFRKYLEEGSSSPWVVLTKENSETSTAHWSNSIAVTLRSKVGWTDEEINEKPLTEALTDFFKWCESEGMVTLYGHEQWRDLQSEAIANGEALAKIMESYGT